MVLAMSRPHKHPRTGVYWFRRRVPTDLVERVGRREVTQSLGTRDPAEAKQRYATVLADYEAQWANLRAGARALTEREAHGLAAIFYKKWLAMHRDNPSQEFLWHPELFHKLWTAAPLPEKEPTPGCPGEKPIENIFLPAMRRLCIVQAEYGLTNNDHNRFALAKAIGVALQRASFVLEGEARGVFALGEAPLDPIKNRSTVG